MKMWLRFLGTIIAFIGFGHSYTLHLSDWSFWGWTLVAATGMVLYGANFND